MIIEYLGNEENKYTFSNGKVVVLSDFEKNELFNEKEVEILKNKVEELEMEIETLNSNFKTEIKDLKSHKSELEKMSLYEFFTTKWTGGMSVEYLENTYDVSSVDFEKNIIWIEIPQVNIVMPVSYSQCRLLEK